VTLDILPLLADITWTPEKISAITLVIAIRGCYLLGVSKGDFLLRLDPDELDRVRKAAHAEGKTVSDFIREGIEMRLVQAGFPRPATRESLLAEIADTAAKLRSGYVLVPSAEALPPERPDSWSGIMDSGGDE
jgi:Ribbon-helix-helix protein, copG family